MKYLSRILLIAVFSAFCMNEASASLLISPTKAVFEDRQRVKEIVLINTSSQVNTYRLGWVEQTQTDKMEYEKLSPSELSSFRKASDFVRFSPKQVRLQPGERQVVKMLLRRKANMPEGDYRSHLMFTIIPNTLDQNSVETTDAPTLKLNVFINYSIPIVVRNGQANENVQIVAVNKFITTDGSGQKGKVEIQLAKDSKFGAYGKLELLGKDPETGSGLLLGQLNGFNFLHENSRTSQVISVKDYELLNRLSSVTVRYTSDVGNRGIIASKEISL